MKEARFSGFGFRTTVSRKDQADLRWFFEVEDRNRYGDSSFVVCIERLELLGPEATPCKRCGGEESADPRQARGGSGFLENPAPRDDSSSAGFDFRSLPPAADIVCPSCRGRGWLLRAHATHSHQVNARPRRSKVAAVAPEPALPEFSDLRKLARIAERVADVAERSLLAVAVLAAYYGVGGGSLGALWSFTSAGERMLENNPLKLPPAVLYANLRAAEHYSPTETRSLLVRQANESAEELLGIAHAFWNATEEPEPLRPAA